jgi:hypothetical protein
MSHLYQNARHTGLRRAQEIAERCKPRASGGRATTVNVNIAPQSSARPVPVPVRVPVAAPAVPPRPAIAGAMPPGAPPLACSASAVVPPVPLPAGRVPPSSMAPRRRGGRS